MNPRWPLVSSSPSPPLGTPASGPSTGPAAGEGGGRGSGELGDAGPCGPGVPPRPWPTSTTCLERASRPAALPLAREAAWTQREEARPDRGQATGQLPSARSSDTWLSPRGGRPSASPLLRTATVAAGPASGRRSGPTCGPGTPTALCPPRPCGPAGPRHPTKHRDRSRRAAQLCPRFPVLPVGLGKEPPPHGAVRGTAAEWGRWCGPVTATRPACPTNFLSVVVRPSRWILFAMLSARQEDTVTDSQPVRCTARKASA